MRKFLGVTGVVLCGFSCFIALGGLINITKPDNDNLAGDIVLLLFFIAAAVGGFILAKTHLRAAPAKKLTEQEKEDLVLKLASSRNGRITRAELARDSALSLAESQKILEHMCEIGVAQLHVTDEGNLVYAFPGLISADEKATAKDALHR